MKDLLTLWAPRVAGLGMAVFLSLFAFDGFSRASLIDVGMNLIPALAVLVITLVSWQRPLVGAVAFIVLGVAYAIVARRRTDWMLAISGPLAFAALLYFLSWLQVRRTAP